MISISGYNLLVDTGDSVSRALLSQQIYYNSINGILITHLHPDHFSGFAELFVQMKMNMRKNPLQIFVHRTLLDKLKDFLTFSYIFIERMDFPLKFITFDFDEEIRIYSDLAFTARKNSHLDDYKKYDSSLSYACGSFMFSSGNIYTYYSGDIGSGDDLYLFKDHKTDLFITEAAHVSLDSIFSAADKLNPARVILTHINDADTSGIKIGLEKSGRNNIIIAEDGLLISV